MTAQSDTVAAIRRFNRFYTRAIGVLDRAFLGGPFTLAESRVLYEMDKTPGVTPKAVGAELGLDPGYLSRILAKLERGGLVRREPCADDGRSVRLHLTPAGAEAFAEIDRRQAARVAAMVEGLAPGEQDRLIRGLGDAERLLAPGRARPPAVLRRHRAGDMGWVVERHAEIYGREYGWGSGIEALTARIVADFLQDYDPARERCWIAERDGERLGSVFLVREPGAEGVARLRLLLLTPAARGEGLGWRLVDECLAFARAAGYREVVLLTHAALTQARKIYADTGFRLEESWTHDEFGAPAVSETWRLKL